MMAWYLFQVIVCRISMQKCDSSQWCFPPFSQKMHKCRSTWCYTKCYVTSVTCITNTKCICGHSKAASFFSSSRKTFLLNFDKTAQYTVPCLRITKVWRSTWTAQVGQDPVLGVLGLLGVTECAFWRVRTQNHVITQRQYRRGFRAITTSTAGWK